MKDDAKRLEGSIRKISISAVAIIAITLFQSAVVAMAAERAASLGDRVCSGVSDAYAKSFVIANVEGGQAIARRMVDRSCEDRTLYSPATRQPMYNTTSNVWGGYVDTVTYPGSVVLDVESYVKYQRASDSYGSLSSWIGIGGVHGTGHLAQDGVYNTSPADTFYELYPSPAHGTGVYPHVGDQLLLLVQKDSSNGQYYFLEDDITTGKYASQEFAFTPDTSTAEWITESYPGPVPSCSPINFSTANWADQTGNWWIQNPHSSTLAYSLISPQGGGVTPSGISGSNAFTNYMTA
jgi:hypothetical protein